MYDILCIHSSVDGHLACFHLIGITNSAATNIGIQVSVFLLSNLLLQPSYTTVNNSISTWNLNLLSSSFVIFDWLHTMTGFPQGHQMAASLTGIISQKADYDFMFFVF